MEPWLKLQSGIPTFEGRREMEQMELMRILGSHKLRSLKGNILSFLERSQVIRNSSWVLQSLRLHRKTCIREELGNFSDKKKRVRTQWSNLFIGNFLSILRVEGGVHGEATGAGDVVTPAGDGGGGTPCTPRDIYTAAVWWGWLLVSIQDCS